MSDFYFNPDGSDELYHYGVPGMKWGQRKGNHSTNILTFTRKGTTWDDKLKQQQRRERHGDGGINGNTSSTNMKRDRYQTDAKYRATVDRQRIKKAADGIKKLKTVMSSDTVKKSASKGKKVAKFASKSAKQIINNRKRQEKGKEIVRKLLDPSEYINKDGYYKQRRSPGTIIDRPQKFKKRDTIKY